MSESQATPAQQLRFLSFVLGIMIGLAAVIVGIAIYLRSWAFVVIATGLLGTSLPLINRFKSLRSRARSTERR